MYTGITHVQVTGRCKYFLQRLTQSLVVFDVKGIATKLDMQRVESLLGTDSSNLVP